MLAKILTVAGLVAMVHAVVSAAQHRSLGATGLPPSEVAVEAYVGAVLLVVGALVRFPALLPRAAAAAMADRSYADSFGPRDALQPFGGRAGAVNAIAARGGQNRAGSKKSK